MSEKSSEPHDVRTILHLVRMMKRYDLTALDFINGPTKIRLRRQGHEQAFLAAPAPAAAPAPVAYQPAPTATQRPEPPAAAPPASTGIVIESPMVGTFYAANTPNAAPYVSVGSVIRPDTTVCIIEAMKVFTDIPAGVSGTVTEVLVKNGQSVEFGQALFRVNPA